MLPPSQRPACDSAHIQTKWLKGTYPRTTQDLSLPRRLKQQKTNNNKKMNTGYCSRGMLLDPNGLHVQTSQRDGLRLQEHARRLRITPTGPYDDSSSCVLRCACGRILRFMVPMYTVSFTRPRISSATQTIFDETTRT